MQTLQDQHVCSKIFNTHDFQTSTEWFVNFFVMYVDHNKTIPTVKMLVANLFLHMPHNMYNIQSGLLFIIMIMIVMLVMVVLLKKYVIIRNIIYFNNHIVLLVVLVCVLVLVVVVVCVSTSKIEAVPPLLAIKVEK